MTVISPSPTTLKSWQSRRGGTVGCSSLGRAETRAVTRDNGRTKAHSALWGEAASATQIASIIVGDVLPARRAL